jgi:hypothetical protein
MLQMCEYGQLFFDFVLIEEVRIALEGGSQEILEEK